MNGNESLNVNVVLTGASSGIGRATALILAKRGCNLVLAARNEDGLNEVLHECKQLGVQCFSIPTDVTDAQAVQKLANKAVEELGRIDVWINNAGIGTIGSFFDTPIEAHDQVIRTNLLGYIHGAHAVIPYFFRQRTGILINVNSAGGFTPTPMAVSYTASKFGIRGFSESLRNELIDWPDIHICDLYPTFIDSPGLHHAGNFTGRQIKPIPPVYDPFDVAKIMARTIRFPRSSVVVGYPTYVARFAHFIAPRLFGWLMNRAVKSYLKKAPRVATTDGNLYAPSDDTSIHGGYRSDDQANVPVKLGLTLAGIAMTVWLLQKSR